METSNKRGASEAAAHTVPSDDVPMADISSSTGGHIDGNESPSAPNANNVMHQRRRVNPESLALRLGPDLVRDLDALITPGNTEMPSFTVRKELQERYNIDRRHIYDYFHSRGLRVVKEDKHGNPVPTARDISTPLPNLRSLRQAPIKNSRSQSSYSVVAERKLFKPRGVTKAKPGRPKKNLLMNPKVIPAAGETNESHDLVETNDGPVSENSPGAIPTPTYVAVNPLLPHISHPSVTGEDDHCIFSLGVNPLDESFSVKRAIGDIAYAYRHKLVFERMQELTEFPAKLALTSLDREISWNDTSPCPTSDRGLLVPHCAKPLTRDERQAIYKTMSDSIGPAHGIQECQGTYRRYMQARTKLYFEGLQSVPYHTQQPARTSILPDRKPPLGTNEFRYWLSETRFLKHDGTDSSPWWLHSSHRNASMAKQDVDGVSDRQYRQLSISYWVPTLDELFATPGDDLNNDDTITDSPVVRTREVTWRTAHAHVADGYSAGVAETRQAGQAQLHGLSGFPGIQQVKTRMPLVEMDSQLQYAERVSYVAHSGQHSTLSDTQRRGRKMSNNARVRLPSCGSRRPQIRDPDRIRTRPVTSRDARKRTPSAAGDI